MSLYISIRKPVFRLEQATIRIPRLWPRRRPLLNLDDSGPIKARVHGEDVWLQVRSISSNSTEHKGTITLVYSKQ